MPYIQNRINENASREQKIKGYYENKLLRYKGALNKLHLNYLKKEKLLNDQYKINKGKGFKVFIEKNKGEQTPQPIKIPEIQYNYNNLRYNNCDANYNQNQQPLTDLNNNLYIANSKYGYYQNNNCNCNCNCCYNIGSNCMNNCCCCCCCCCSKKKNIRVFLDKMSINRDCFFGKCKNDYYTGLCNTRSCCCSQSLIPFFKIKRNRPFVEIVESSTDEDEEGEEYEVIENYPPIPAAPVGPAGPAGPPGLAGQDLPPENKVINYEPKKIYEYETRYYTKIIRVHKHIPRKKKPKVVKPKIVEPKKEEPKPKKEEPKPKKEEPKPKKEEPKPKKEEPKPKKEEPKPKKEEPKPKKEEPKKKKPKKKKPKKKEKRT